tara:strand:+ start:374 stop:805 length:432 start_codon:yes stop_codon:yes gene_type:complete
MNTYQHIRWNRHFTIYYTKKSSKHRVEYECTINAKTLDDAKEGYYEEVEDWDDDVLSGVGEIKLTNKQIVKNEMYELVIEELFGTRDFGYKVDLAWEYDGQNDQDLYDDEVASINSMKGEGIDKIMLEHDAYNRYMNTRINNQ